mmetsp:Transcript_30498/g.73596  ORF Transcript_30498/g.73596 Transcript_30498/m.73596 type:complete len:138 (-) Transcript_30498:457-870(-)
MNTPIEVIQNASIIHAEAQTYEFILVISCIVVASDERTTPPIFASVTKNSTLIEVIALRHAVAANRAKSSPIQKGGSRHDASTSITPIITNIVRPNAFLTNKMQVSSTASPTTHVPTRALMLLRRNMSMIPPVTAVP